MSDKDNTKPEDDGLQATDEANTVDSEGHASTPLHEATRAAVESAGDNKPHGAVAGGDDEDNDSDSGDDTGRDDDERKVWTDPDISSDTSGVYDTRKQVPNIFQRYASTPDARNAAEQFTPKTFRSNGTSEPDNIAPLGGDRLNNAAAGGAANTHFSGTTDQPVASATLDGNALRAVGAAISEATRANFDTSALQAQAAAITQPVLNVRAAAPVLVPLMPLERTPTPQ
jgi:hypothetical protein